MDISYTKLWKLLIDKGITKTEMRKKAGISTNALAKMGKSELVSINTLAKIADVLHCGIDDIVDISNVNHSEKKRKVISLFSGAGGMDIGFENAGFEIAVAVEMDPSCCDTLRTNRPNLPIINKNITEVATDEILSSAGLIPMEAALVIGGPPCQSFSLAGLRKGLDDDRGKLLFEFVRIVREALPIGFVLENVKGLTNWDSGRALKLLIEELTKPIEYNGDIYKYEVSNPKVLNAVDYGVPQFRERLILVGNRCGFSFDYPEPIKETDRKTVNDAIGFLPPPEKPSETALAVAKSIKGRREKHGY